MTPVELSCHRNLKAKNFQLYFSPTHAQIPNGNGTVQNRKSMAFYYAVTKWKYHLQEPDIVVHNDQQPSQKFLSSKNANNKVNKWSLELATYNITFEWISSACNKAADCLSWLVDVKNTPAPPKASISMLVTSTPDGPATHTHSKTCNPTDTTLPSDV